MSTEAAGGRSVETTDTAESRKCEECWPVADSVDKVVRKGVCNRKERAGFKPVRKARLVSAAYPSAKREEGLIQWQNIWQRRLECIVKKV